MRHAVRVQTQLFPLPQALSRICRTNWNAAFNAWLRSHSGRLPAARCTSPVERGKHFNPRCSRPAWEPLPAPGAPSRINLHGSCVRSARGLQRTEGPWIWIHAARSGFPDTLITRNLGAGLPRCRDPGHTSAGSAAARARSFRSQFTGSTCPTRKIHEAALAKATAATIRNAQ
jgi:hypothetical protein